MSEVVEDTKGKTRDLPISARLRALLIQAGEECHIDRIRVTSGGQCALGTCKKRTGSPRHDLGNAADLELWTSGRALNFTNETELPVFTKFITAVARLGATGLGAGRGPDNDYMGPKTIHVGFGRMLVWGHLGRSANAPEWLRQAAHEGWTASERPLPRSYRIVARKGLTLRAGPDTRFKALSLLTTGTTVNVVSFDGPLEDWARVDLEGDGLVDGHLHNTFIVPIDPFEIDTDAEGDDCSGD